MVHANVMWVLHLVIVPQKKHIFYISLHQIYQKDSDPNDYIVCARGTSQKCDLMQDIGIAFGKGPEERFPVFLRLVSNENSQ